MAAPQVFALVFFIGLLVGLAAVTWRLRDLRSENEILRRMELEARAQSALAVAQLNCAAPCVVATESDCSDESVADYCLATVRGGLDLNVDGDRADFVEPLRARLVSGLKLEQGVCEDMVYCREIRLCACKVTLERCVDALCRRFRATSVPSEAADRVRAALPFGRCLNESEHRAKRTRNLTWDASLETRLARSCA